MTDARNEGELRINPIQISGQVTTLLRQIKEFYDIANTFHTNMATATAALRDIRELPQLDEGVRASIHQYMLDYENLIDNPFLPNLIDTLPPSLDNLPTHYLTLSERIQGDVFGQLMKNCAEINYKHRALETLLQMIEAAHPEFLAICNKHRLQNPAALYSLLVKPNQQIGRCELQLRAMLTDLERTQALKNTLQDPQLINKPTDPTTIALDQTTWTAAELKSIFEPALTLIGRSLGEVDRKVPLYGEVGILQNAAILLNLLIALETERRYVLTLENAHQYQQHIHTINNMITTILSGIKNSEPVNYTADNLRRLRKENNYTKTREKIAIEIQQKILSHIQPATVRPIFQPYLNSLEHENTKLLRDSIRYLRSFKSPGLPMSQDADWKTATVRRLETVNSITSYVYHSTTKPVNLPALITEISSRQRDDRIGDAFEIRRRRVKISAPGLTAALDTLDTELARPLPEAAADIAPPLDDFKQPLINQLESIEAALQRIVTTLREREAQATAAGRVSTTGLFAAADADEELRPRFTHLRRQRRPV